jgi:hypothetical protein
LGNPRRVEGNVRIARQKLATNDLPGDALGAIGPRSDRQTGGFVGAEGLRPGPAGGFVAGVRPSGIEERNREARFTVAPHRDGPEREGQNERERTGAHRGTLARALLYDAARVVRTLASVALLAGRLVLAQAFDPASVSPQAPTSTAPSDAAPPAEVTVRGTKPAAGDIGSDQLRGRDARSVPGTFGEPLQAVESLPGISPMVSGLPYFYVRGAPPADTGYFVDGIPLPTLFHIGPGPSVVPPALLDHVDFFPSTAPARYGRFVGGIIAGDTTAPSPVARGEASVRLFDASAFAESPIGPSSTALVAGRYGYPNLLLSLFAPNLSLNYGDYTARVTRALSGADAVSLFAIGSYDREEDTSQKLIPIASQFHRFDLRYDRKWADGALRLATTLGYDRSSDSSSTETVSSVSGRLRLELSQRFGANVRLSAGADANAARSTYDYSGLAEPASNLEQIAGAYADLRARPARVVQIDAGTRFDAYRFAGAVTTSFDPKLAVRVFVSPDVTWVSTLGIAHQQPTYLFPLPGLQISPSQGLQTTYQFAEGAEAQLAEAVRAKITAFYNVQRNVNDFVSDCGAFAVACSVVDQVDGRTFGVELLLQRPLTRRLGGWIAYTLSRAERRVGGVPYLSPFDRTHVVSAVLRYDFGGGIDAGARGTYYSGRPIFRTSLFRDGRARSRSVRADPPSTGCRSSIESTSEPPSDGPWVRGGGSRRSWSSSTSP